MADSEEGDLPEGVVDLRYRELDSRLDDQMDLLRDSVKHDRRMVRLLLLFLGIIATAGGYITSAGDSSAPDPTRPILQLGTFETPLFAVVGVATIFYIYSLTTHLGMSTNHPSISGSSANSLQTYNSV